MLGFLISASAFDSSLLSDIKFYIILVVLAAVLITICVLFATKEKFKFKAEDKMKDKEYIPPQIIKVEDNIKDEAHKD